GQAVSAAGETHYIVTEYVDGETLRHRIASAPLKRLPLTETVNIALQIADALSAAHPAGIVHRDIKPENVMLRRDGYAKVLDFGLAKLTELQPPGAKAGESSAQGVSSNPGLIMGTASYMSPEQARGLRVDARTDIFSLGAVIYEMLTGSPPFRGDTPNDVITAILSEEPRPVSEYLGPVAPELEHVVRKALSRDPDQRYQSARDLALDLKGLTPERASPVKYRSKWRTGRA